MLNLKLSDKLLHAFEITLICTSKKKLIAEVKILFIA